MTELNLTNGVINFVANVMIATFNIICWNSCLQLKSKNKLIKYIIFVISISILVTIFIFTLPKPIKMIAVFFTLILVCYLFVAKNIKQSIIVVICSQLIVWLAEYSFMIVVLLFQLKNIDDITSIPSVFLILNLYIFIISLILLKMKLPQKLYKILINYANAIKGNEALIYSLMIVIITIISSAESYLNLPTTVVLIINIIMALVFITLVIMSSKTKASYNKISSKYQTSISSLKEYEVMINQFSMYSHENRNEFYTVRNMLRDGEKRDDVIKYIDALINNKIKDNEKIMKKTAKIPSGGLRATIYSKLCLMDELNIKHTLSISRDVKTTDLIELDEALVLKICNILGVFLDNAIDAVKNLKKKEISVEIYIIDEYLCIDITNNFKGNLNLDRISEEKYTTKGDGHGYGLTLVNQILNEELGKLENERSINRDTFTQTLKIKM